MKGKRFGILFSFCVFMIGYYLILTVLLPTIIVSEPYSLTEGTYVSYLVEDLDFRNEVIRNGTYTWKILSIYRDSIGRRMARINETFVGNSEWRGYKHSIPPNGRVTEIDLKQGVVNDLRIWFGNYYNEYLFDRSVFYSGARSPLEGIDVRKISFQGKQRICTAVSVLSSPIYRRTSTDVYDRATGILLLYRASFRGIQTRVTAVSTNIDLVPYNSYSKPTLDLLLFSSLFVLPLLGAFASLYFLKRDNIMFSFHFWIVASVVAGTTLSLITISPSQIHFALVFPPLLFLVLIIPMILPSILWAGAILVSVILIDRFGFRIIQKRP